MAETEKLELTAYEVSVGALPLRASERKRDWMEETPERYAYRCLPLVIANQAGWQVLCPVDFTATWSGGTQLDAIQLRFDGPTSSYISSHFGNGILTFSLGYLFRTAAGHNLWCKGPTNQPKDGIAPLEGLIETDWSPFTFTMNWKFTRPGHVRFRKDEPIATLLPLPRGYLHGFDPVIRPISLNPDLEREFQAWCQSRSKFIVDLKQPGSPAQDQGWQRNYMLGQDLTQRRFEEHETKLQLTEFRHEY